MPFEAQEFKIGAPRPRTVKVIVKGHLKGVEQDIEQELTFEIPAAQPNNDQAALELWGAVSQVGGLTSKESDGVYHFYPMSLFSSLTAEFGVIQKVTL